LLNSKSQTPKENRGRIKEKYKTAKKPVKQ
jgi:hypothetical protein